jgi:hypothetical protein
VTDSTKPNRPPRRKDASREPPTIDLKATVVEAPATDQEVVPETAASEPDRPADAAVESTPATEPAPEEQVPSESTVSESTASEPLPEAAAADEPVAAGSVAGDSTAREPRRSPGFGSLLGAGLLGGVVGAGAVWAVQTWQAPAPAPISAPSSTASADPRVAQLQQQVGALARQDAVQALEGRLTALESGQQGLVQRVDAAQQVAERSAARAEEALSRPGPEASARAPAAPDNSQAVSELQNRVSAVEGQLQERVQAVSGLVDTLQERVRAVAGTVESVQRQVAENGQALQGRVAQAAETVQRQLSEQDQRLSALTSQVAEGGSESTRAGIRVVLADRLTSTLSEGAPYAEVLAALRGFGVDQGRLAALEPFAGKGAPTPAALAESFRPLGDRIIRESRAGDSWSDRLLRMADKVVTVRTVDEPGSSNPSSIVARIESALANGDLASAASAWDSLPEPARRLSEAWGQQLKQRAAAEAAARAIAADAVAALNTATR